MKKILAKFLVLAVAVLVLATSCALVVNDDDDKDKDKDTDVPETYKEFFNYPIGRKDPTGLLQITNNANSQALLFTNEVSPYNYIGTVDKLSSIMVKLPEQKFYTIVAVDKKLYEEFKDQAERYSDLTYYSKTQPYSMSVSPSSVAGGGGQWIITNRTNYWVSFKDQSNSGEIYAVVAPNTLRAVVPIQFNKPYYVIPHYYRELKYRGDVIALAESDDIRNANIISVTTTNRTVRTEIGGENSTITLPNGRIRPALVITNSLVGQNVEVYYGTNNRLASQGNDEFILNSGVTSIFIGVEDGNNVKNVCVWSAAWGNLYVKQDMAMEENKVYKIEFSGNGANSYTTTMEAVDAETFYQ